MKNIYRGALIISIALTGCAGSKLTSSQSAKTESSQNSISLQAQIDGIQKKIEACVLELNQTEDAKFVNEHILVLIPNSPNAKGLFNSNEKIAADQVVVLNRFKVSTLKCRAIANELPNSDLVEVYTSFYSKIDAVYADLIDQRITIGVANQERAMRIQYARTRWTEILKTQTGV